MKHYLVIQKMFCFPMDEFIASEALAISPELKYERINTLSELLVNNKNSCYNS